MLQTKIRSVFNKLYCCYDNLLCIENDHDLFFFIIIFSLFIYLFIYLFFVVCL